MPKAKTSLGEKIKAWITALDTKDVFQVMNANGNSVFCKACSKVIACSKKCHIEQHQRGPGHKEKLKKPYRQTLVNLPAPEVESKTFYVEMCEALISANIPLYKLKSPKLNNFLQKYINRKIPDESTLRKNYLPQCYLETIENIQNDIGSDNIWITIDETTDILGRSIANMLIGKLNDEESGKPYLIASKELTKTNNETMARFVNESLGILWPQGIHYERVLLMLTDGAPYMIKAGTHLKIFYPNLIHLTCLAHGVHLVCEIIRNQYENVNGLISNTKKIFLKAPLHLQTYKESLPNLPLPPEPVITRWATWLEAALFYCDYFDQIKKVVMSFDPNDSAAIQKVQNYYLQDKNLKRDLLYIKSNFKVLITSIKSLETTGMALNESLKIIYDLKTALITSEGSVAKMALAKLQLVLAKNPGFEAISQIYELLCGAQEIEIDSEVDLTLYKYARITSCDVERSFSYLKNILTDKRTSFTNQNFEKYIVCYANAKFE